MNHNHEAEILDKQIADNAGAFMTDEQMQAAERAHYDEQAERGYREEVAFDEKRKYFNWFENVMRRPDFDAFIEEAHDREIALGITDADRDRWVRECAQVEFEF